MAKSWRYGLTLLERPSSMPHILGSWLFHHVHLGELLRLEKFRPWLQTLDVQTIIDVGAHAGEFSSAAAITFPKAQIYAFEPLPDAFNQLCSRMRRHDRFRAFHTALGNKRALVSFHQHAFSKASSVLPMAPLHKALFPWSAKASTIRVEQSRLDDYLEEIVLHRSVLLKIDVQGYELPVLQGAVELLRRVDLVIIELSFEPLYDGQSSFPAVYEVMNTHDLAFSGCIDVLLAPDDRRILQADLLFIKSNLTS